MFFNNTAPDKESAGLDALSAGLRLPELVKTMKFVHDVIRGHTSEIKDKTIEDAFDCIMYRNKAFIKSSYLSKEDKDKAINESEIDGEQQKAMFKACLRIKCE